MNIIIQSEKLDKMQQELADWRTTAALIGSVIEDSKRYNQPLDTDWILMMLRDVRQDGGRV